SFTHPPSPRLLMTNHRRPIELDRATRRFRRTVRALIRGGGTFSQPPLGLTQRLPTSLRSLKLLGQLIATSVPIQLVLLPVDPVRLLQDLASQLLIVKAREPAR